MPVAISMKPEPNIRGSRKTSLLFQVTKGTYDSLIPTKEEMDAKVDGAEQKLGTRLDKIDVKFNKLRVYAREELFQTITDHIREVELNLARKIGELEQRIRELEAEREES